MQLRHRVAEGYSARMKTVWNEADHRELLERLDRLKPDAAPRWGKFTAPRMVCHLVDAMKMASGTLPVQPKNLPIRHPPLKQLIIYWLPFPKGAPTAPELLARLPSEWHGEVRELKQALEAFRQRGPTGPFVPHPAFGKLSARAWGVLVYRHTDHHLKQFGV
jgi:Protein of unknown function (DUF1569)